MPPLPPRLSRPTLAMLPRVSDQIGFVYVDRSRVERDDNGVHAVFRTPERGVERVYLPTASIAALLLGPGTSITQPAAAQTMRDGAVIILSGESGSHFNSSVRGGHRRSCNRSMVSSTSSTATIRDGHEHAVSCRGA